MRVSYGLEVREMKTRKDIKLGKTVTMKTTIMICSKEIRIY